VIQETKDSSSEGKVLRANGYWIPGNPEELEIYCWTNLRLLVTVLMQVEETASTHSRLSSTNTNLASASTGTSNLKDYHGRARGERFNLNHRRLEAYSVEERRAPCCRAALRPRAGGLRRTQRDARGPGAGPGGRAFMLPGPSLGSDAKF
jgi:hypothetical protein